MEESNSYNEIVNELQRYKRKVTEPWRYIRSAAELQIHNERVAEPYRYNGKATEP